MNWVWKLQFDQSNVPTTLFLSSSLDNCQTASQSEKHSLFILTMYTRSSISLGFRDQTTLHHYKYGCHKTTCKNGHLQRLLKLRCDQAKYTQTPKVHITRSYIFLTHWILVRLCVVTRDRDVSFLKLKVCKQGYIYFLPSLKGTGTMSKDIDNNLLLNKLQIIILFWNSL